MQKLFQNIFIVSIISLQISEFASEEVPSFRIVAPQNLCKQNDSESGSKQPQSVAITFQPKDGIKLSYKFKIFFKILGTETLTQRETLLVWKAVRALEQRLNSQDRLQIMKNNVAVVNKFELVPGVGYIFHVAGITDAGESSRERSFTIHYADGVLQNGNELDGINFLLIGSEEIVASIQYSVKAKVNFCKPKNDYYIEWKISDLAEKYQTIENTISSTLILPPNALSAERKTAIEAKVKETYSNKILAKDTLWVEVLNKGFQAMIIPCAGRIGEGTHLTFRLFLRNYDHVQQLEIKWWLQDAATSQVIQTKTDDRNYFKVFFEKAGYFQVFTQLKINDIVTKLKSDIEVINSAFISYEFQDIPNLNPSAYEEFQFSVTVLNMVGNCEASWLSAQEEGFKLIPNGILEKEHYGYTKVSNLEKYYLQELVDFSNSTVNREITLNIPGNYKKTDIKWAGLEGDAMYKFRLDVTCPKPFSERNVQQNIAAEEPWIKVVTSYFTIDIHTNAPPQASRVSLEPLQGLALKTIFILNAQEAKDLLLDFPMSYELKIMVDKWELSMGKYFQYKNWETILPYTLEPLKILVEVCDIRQACSTIANNSKLSINYEEFSEREYTTYEENIIAHFMRTEYQDAFNGMMMATLTFKSAESVHYAIWLTFVKVAISKEMNKLMEQQPAHKIFISSDAKLTFVIKSKEILDYTQQMSRDVLEKLLELLENLTEYTDDMAKARFKRSDRTKRIINHSQALYTKTQLNLLEDLLKSDKYSAQAVQTFMQKITNLCKKLCLNAEIHQETLKSDLVSLTLRKFQGDFLQQLTTHILQANVLDKLILQFKTINTSYIKPHANYCLTIKSYNFQETSHEGGRSLIEYNIYEIANNNQLHEMELEEHTMASKFQLDIYPLEQHINNCLMKTSYTSSWSADSCISHVMDKFLRCSCSQTGFLTTAHINMPSTTVKPKLNDKILPTSASSLPIFNSLTSPAATQVLLTTTHLPSTIATAGTKSPSHSNDMSTTTTTTSNIPATNKDAIQKATSPLSYIIPLVFVLVLLLLAMLYLLHRRRLSQASKTTTNITSSTILEFRKPATGIKYANIYDDHLLTGNF